MVPSVAYSYQNAALPRVEAYATFLIEHYLKEYTALYRSCLTEHGIDTDTYFPVTEMHTTEEHFREAAHNHLVLLAEGRWYEQIETTLSQILAGGCDTAEQLKAAISRLFLIGYIRRKAYKQFIDKYTSSVSEALQLIEEIDHYSLVFEKAVNEKYLSNLSGLLELREALYKDAQRMAHIGNWSLDIIDGKVTYSDEVGAICGFPPKTDYLFLRDVKALLQPEEWDELWRRYFLLKHTGKPLFYITTLKLPDGDERIVELKAKSVKESDHGRQLMGTIQDVTLEQGRIRSLQERERLYRHSEIMANIGNWSIDLNTGYTTFSEGLFRIYEMEPHKGNVNMAEPRSYADPDDRKNIDYHVARCREDGIRYELQYWITLPEGHRKLLHCMAEAVNDANGQRYGIIGTIRDITEEYQLIQQLQYKEVLYKQAQAMGRIGNWVNDLQTGNQDWSEELYHLFEVDPAAPNARQQAADRILISDHELLSNHLRLCEAQGIPYDCQYRVTMPNGGMRHFWSKGEAVRNEAGEIIKLIGTVQDITSQVTVESRLREQQLFTQKVTDIAPTMISVYDVRTNAYDFINLAVEKMLGYRQQEVKEQGLGMILDRIHPDDKPWILEELEAAKDRANRDSAEVIEEFSYRILHQDNTYRWFHTFATVFQRDELGMITQMIHICIDVSAEKQAEQAMNQKNLLLQQSNSSLEEFAFIASHDLQEPLRKISTFGNMLQTLQEDHLSEIGKSYLRKIVDSSIRMQAMINDLLSVSVIAGNRAFKKENLQTLLEDVLTTLDYKIEQTGATIEQEKPLPSIKVIASQIRQLFQNLISNSLKFARKDVKPVITIKAEMLKGDESELQLKNDGQHYLKITLTDNGIGFNNDYASKIFVIFQRLHGKTDYEGTGIGLAVCRKISEHHNGFIYASGEVGVGATFSVVLPA